MQETFLQLRKQYIENRFSGLNAVQREAALQTGGPMLILAGAGSGKTTVVVNRIKNLLEFGDAYLSDILPGPCGERETEALRAAVERGEPLEEDVRALLRTGFIEPWNILAITFTNKAAAELKSRICESVGERGNDVFAATFHSACVRFLRRDAELLGYPKNFTIYDSDDSQRALKEVYKSLGVDDKLFPPRAVLGRIGRIKDEMLSPAEFAERPGGYQDKMLAKIYEAYQRRLRAAGAFDFDDLIFYTVRLLQDNPEVRAHYHRRFKYVMVDEYQDTSYAQYRLVELLTGPHRNLCVVGDDDQSIYRFRGATIENILSFEEHFPGARVVRLEQNYRSTERILDAANQVISNNRGRKGKTLWTDRGEGERIHVYCADDERDEAAYTAQKIAQNQKEGIPLKRQAVLYRMNAQSNALENYFARAGIPYRVVGGLRFYDRAEIKDVLAYLCLIDNPGDDLRLTRIINRPARKIGDTTVAAVAQIAAGLGVPMLEVIREAAGYPVLSRAKTPLAGFYKLYAELCAAYEQQPLHEFVDFLLDRTGLRRMLEEMGEEGAPRLENIEEFLSSIRAFEQENPEGDLTLFLEEIALVSSVDSYDESADAVSLMTLHSAKGLEFDCVYMIGLEEGIFPGEQSRYNPDDLEEERRLAYVGITRARKKLYLSRAAVRMLFGQTRRYPESRFVQEFSPELKQDDTPRSRLREPREGESPAQRDYRRANAAAKAQLGRGGITVGGAPKKTSADAVRFAAGDRVDHKIFGQGTVASAMPLGGDILLEIDFDKGGRKKTMANYAPLKKLEPDG